jgi:hypothetical protein
MKKNRNEQARTGESETNDNTPEKVFLPGHEEVV